MQPKHRLNACQRARSYELNRAARRQLLCVLKDQSRLAAKALAVFAQEPRERELHRRDRGDGLRDRRPTEEGPGADGHVRGAVGVAKVAKQFDIPVFCLSGGLGDGADDVLALGIDAVLSVCDRPLTLDACMSAGSELIESATARLCRIVKASRSG